MSLMRFMQRHGARSGLGHGVCWGLHSCRWVSAALPCLSRIEGHDGATRRIDEGLVNTEKPWCGSRRFGLAFFDTQSQARPP